MTKAGLAAALVCLLGATPVLAAGVGNALRPGDHPKLDRKLNDRSLKGSGTSRVIVILKTGFDDSADVKKLGGKTGRWLDSINGHVAELPNNVIRRLADNPAVASIHWDRPTGGEMNYAAVTVGARAVQQNLGFTGAGVGVAVIDSGITSWHDDLTYAGSSSLVQVKNSQRVPAFVDFVAGRTSPYDDNGHGTHVSGIIAGNGKDSSGARAGIAPSAHIVSLKVLDANGRGVISNVIAALDWAVANKTKYNIRVINLSVGAPITESYRTDPLTLAAKRAVDAGLVVVTAAGNLGKNAAGQIQYGGITAPGNAPWVLTVGAYSHNGTVIRTDDTMASFSSRGPSAIDYEAKPDVVAPGVGIVSLSDPGGLFYTTKVDYLVKGTLLSLVGQKPYLSLSGTSMASPMVAGTVALMMQANPKLTPNLAKAIIEYTAQVYPGYNALTEGAGFLNAKGAVELARFYYTAQPGQTKWINPVWSRSFNWGSHRVTHGIIKPNAPAWKTGVVWGTARQDDGDNIVWGTACRNDCDNIVWGTTDSQDNIVWGTASGDSDNIVWGTFADGDNIVWGTVADGDNIVWGTDCGGADCDNIVWGTSSDADNIVWGTAADGDNIVWGTSGDFDNIVWGTSANEDVTWSSSGDDTPLYDDPDAPPPVFDSVNYDDLFGPPAVTTTTILGGVL
jgi:serine protease AprX